MHTFIFSFHIKISQTLNSIQYTKQQIIAHTAPCSSLEYSFDDSEIISSGQDSKIKIYSAFTGEVIEQYGPFGTGVAVSQATLSPDMRYIGTTLKDDYFLIIDRKDYENYNKTFLYKIPLNQTAEQKARGCRSIQFTKNMKNIYIITIGAQDTLRKYSFPELKLINEVSINSSNCLLLSTDNKMIFVGTAKGFQIFNEDLELIDNEESYNDIVYDLSFYKNQFLVVPYHNQKKVVIYDTKHWLENKEIDDEDILYQISSGNLLRTAVVMEKYNLILSSGGLDPKLVALTNVGNRTKTDINDMITQQLVFSKQFHGSPVIQIRVSKDNQSFATIGIDGEMYIIRFNGIENYKPSAEWLQ